MGSGHFNPLTPTEGPGGRSGKRRPFRWQRPKSIEAGSLSAFISNPGDRLGFILSRSKSLNGVYVTDSVRVGGAFNPVVI